MKSLKNIFQNIIGTNCKFSYLQRSALIIWLSQNTLLCQISSYSSPRKYVFSTPSKRLRIIPSIIPEMALSPSRTRQNMPVKYITRPLNALVSRMGNNSKKIHKSPKHLAVIPWRYKWNINTPTGPPSPNSRLQEWSIRRMWGRRIQWEYRGGSLRSGSMNSSDEKIWSNDVWVFFVIFYIWRVRGIWNRKGGIILKMKLYALANCMKVKDVR